MPNSIEIHETTVLKMNNNLNPIYVAVCSCEWESANLHTHRRGAVDDARAHRRDEDLARYRNAR